MEKRASAFMIRTQTVNPVTVLEFNMRIAGDLADGWDILSASPIGIDTGGGTSGGGAVMAFVALVKYEYFDPK